MVHLALDHLLDLQLEHVDQKGHYLLDHLVVDHVQMMGLLEGHMDVSQILVDEVGVYH